MSESKIIIITGKPGSGKTSLGKMISNQLDIPFICKDELKEVLFDSLKWTNTEHRFELEVTSLNIFYFFIEKIIKSGQSLIVETNFKDAWDTGKFKKLKSKYGLKSLQIECFAEKRIRFERFKKRNENGERHAGHDDNQTAMIHFNKKPYKSILSIGGKVIKLNMNDFTKVDYKKIVDDVKNEFKKL